MENFSLIPEYFSRLLMFLVGNNQTIPSSWKCSVRMSLNQSGEKVLFDCTEQTSSMMSVFQAYAFVIRKIFPSLEGKKLLAQVVIYIMKIIRGQNFIFCTGFNSDGSGFFSSTNTEEIANKYLLESTLLENPQATLLLALSFCMVAGPSKLSSGINKEPLISSEGQASLRFLLLLITGYPADVCSSVYTIENGLLKIPVASQQTIGLIEADETSKQYNIGPTLLVPKEKIWVVIYKTHYSTLMCSMENYFEYNISAIDGFKVKSLSDDDSVIQRIKSNISKT